MRTSICIAQAALVASWLLLTRQAAASPTSSPTAATVQPQVLHDLQCYGSVTVFVDMVEDASNALRRLNLQQEDASAPRGECIERMVKALEAHTASTQQSVLHELELDPNHHQRRLQDAPFFQAIESFWMTNSLLVVNATSQCVKKLQSLASVREIRIPERYPMDQPAESSISVNVSAILQGREVAWGVRRVNAPAQWAQGITGQGVVVGIIDSGVRLSHETLRHNYVGEYGWFDPYHGTQAPSDDLGHGTHALGTIVGSHGIGVAPGAKWMACVSGTATAFTEVGVLKCLQFMTCPTDWRGHNRDCSKAPHVVNNSWGKRFVVQFDKYKAVLQPLRTAGIIPVFSAGNEGKFGCRTVSIPAAYDSVIAVGSVDVGDVPAKSSSRGPNAHQQLKPDFTAPGVKVLSASHLADGEYRTLSGTSMAAPHVTGTIALLLSANPGMSYKQVYKYLQQSAELTTLSELTAEDQQCTPTIQSGSALSNNVYGYGRVQLPVDGIKNAKSKRRWFG